MELRFNATVNITHVTVDIGSNMCTMNYIILPRNGSANQTITLSGYFPPHIQDRMKHLLEEWLQAELVAKQLIT